MTEQFLDVAKNTFRYIKIILDNDYVMHYIQREQERIHMIEGKEKNEGHKALDEFHKCKFCGKLFTPSREWQRFCTRKHQREYWKGVQNDKLFLLKKIEKLEQQLTDRKS